VGGQQKKKGYAIGKNAKVNRLYEQYDPKILQKKLNKTVKRPIGRRAQN